MISEFQRGSEESFTPDDPPSSKERLLIHQICEILGLQSISKGTKNQRNVTITRLNGEPPFESLTSLCDRVNTIKRDFKLRFSCRNDAEAHQLIALGDRKLDLTRRLDLLDTAIKTLGNVSLSAYTNQVCQTILTRMKESEGYRRLMDSSFVNTHAIDKSMMNVGQIRSGRKLYVMNNHGKHFISLDVRQASFSVLNRFDSSLFDGKPSWSDYLRSIIPDIPEYFVEARRVRDLSIGHIDNMRVEMLQKLLTQEVFQLLVDHRVFDPVDTIYFRSNDELVFPVAESDIFDTCQHVTSILESKFPLNLLIRIEGFQLLSLSKTRPYFVKKTLFKDGKKEVEYSLKCVEGEHYMTCYRHFFPDSQIQLENDEKLNPDPECTIRHQ
eukprot:TRINITY_DN5510_c0_g1_i1.p1 TRINITY_DN5510_c0_g1~~TRINITY_DN5510_c0_g1_i1.p1  ORF type:complete len:411 (-),score=105.43 TRINITY_DN5510_c0_g1_i1:48-1196(-)